jgi:hypothetical protein
MYYHIYFDKNKGEINRNYLKINEQIKKIKIIIDYQVKSFEELFYLCECTPIPNPQNSKKNHF